MKTASFIRLTSLFAFILICSAARSQVKKEHYRLIVDAGFSADLPSYEDALSLMNLDRYRYIHVRRIIPFEGGNISVELYSGDELEVLYGKQISPLNISETSEDSKVIFVLMPEGQIKVRQTSTN